MRAVYATTSGKCRVIMIKDILVTLPTGEAPSFFGVRLALRVPYIYRAKVRFDNPSPG